MAERVGFEPHRTLRTPQDPLDSVSYRFHNARVAVNASDAVGPCTLGLPSQADSMKRNDDSQPRLLAELAEVRVSQARYSDAANLLEEGSDLLEGFLTKASSPWVQGRIINGARGPDAGRLIAIVEQARGRAILELLLAGPLADEVQSFTDITTLAFLRLASLPTRPTLAKLAPPARVLIPNERPSPRGPCRVRT